MVPSNYLEEIGDEPAGPATPAAAQPAPAAPAAPTPSAAASSKGATATALYDYEAGEDNELSFPEDAIISNVVCTAAPGYMRIADCEQTFPDEDWWHGEYQGRSGLFPANYTKIND